MRKEHTLMAANANLHKAKNEKNDEFYTQLTDVAAELWHYKEHFRGKTVLCNCDNPVWSAFWKYFHLNFKKLGLKKLISTHYDKTEDMKFFAEYICAHPELIKLALTERDYWKADVRKNLCGAEIIDTFLPLSIKSRAAGTMNGLLNGNETYRRILIRRKAG